MSDGPVRLSVTALAQFACRSGDLAGPGVAGPTARDGQRAHQRVQHAQCSQSATMQSEVPLHRHWTDGQHSFKVGGRVDLLDRSAGRLIEIKSTLVPLERLPPGRHALHEAQAWLYAWCLAPCQLQKSLTIELLYLNLLTGEETRRAEQVSVRQITDLAEAALAAYAAWQRVVNEQRLSTRASANELRFPFADFRQGQRDMSAAIFRSVRDREALLVEAPTGTGKTLSAAFPVIKAIGSSIVDHACYLTAKVSGIDSAVKAIRHLQNSGLEISAVVLRAQSRTCFCRNGRCERADDGRCPMTIGFFDRLPAARLELMQSGLIDGDTLDGVAWKHQLCPFELALQMLPWVTLSICDYNYAFDPLVRLVHFSEPRRDTALLVDEAHNLLSRSRDMFSATLDRMAIVQAAELCGLEHAAFARELLRVSDTLLSVGRGLQEDTHQLDSPPSTILSAVQQAISVAMDTLAGGGALSEAANEQFRALCRYAAIAELYHSAHRCLLTVQITGRQRRVILELYCLDASEALARSYQQYHSVTLFSATLSPSTFYRDALGLPDSTRGLALLSPFETGNALQVLVPFIPVKFRERASGMSALVRLLFTVWQQHNGNYLAFFPSYDYLERTREAFVQAYPDVPIWHQSATSSAEERSAQMQAMDDPGHRLGFAILGGVFGEGVDLIGDRLIGVIVVGVGLPGMGTRQALLVDHYRKLGLDGYDYSARFPGFSRVLQTAGRVIRSEDDRGIIVLVDERYAQARYRRLFPAHWQPVVAASVEQLSRQLDAFWNK